MLNYQFIEIGLQSGYYKHESVFKNVFICGIMEFVISEKALSCVFPQRKHDEKAREIAEDQNKRECEYQQNLLKLLKKCLDFSILLIHELPAFHLEI